MTTTKSSERDSYICAVGLRRTSKLAEGLLAQLARPGALPLLFVLYLVPRIAVSRLAVEPFSDAAWYFNRAVGLVAGYGYSEAGVPTAYWPPGWPLTLAMLFKFFGVSLLAVQIFNLVCSLMIGWLTYDLGRRLFKSELAGRASFLLLAIYPNSIGYVPLVWTEVFYTLLLLLGCWLLVARQSTLSLVLGGAVFGMATLVKAQSLLMIPVIYSVDILREKVSIRRCTEAIIKCGAIMLCSLVIVLPWSYRNYQVFGEWIFVSTNGGLTLLTGNNPSARGDYAPNDPLVTSIPRNVANQVEVDKEATRRGIQWVRENPVRFILLLPLKSFWLWGPDGESEWWFQAGFKDYDRHVLLFRVLRYLNQVYYMCLMIGFFLAGRQLLNRERTIFHAGIDWWALPYAIAFYTTLIALVFSGQSRYHYPIMPFVIMCCGWLLVTLCSNHTLHHRASEHPNS